MKSDLSISNIRNMATRISRAGFFHIFGSSFITRILVFITDVLIANLLSKDSYGVFSYAYSIYTIIMLFSGFGLLSGVLQYCAEQRPKNEKASFCKYGLTRGLVVDMVISLIMILAGLSIVFPIHSVGLYLCLFAPAVLLDYVFQFISIVLRSQKLNKDYAILQVVNSLGFLIFGCLGTLYFGISGAIFGKCLAYIVAGSVGIFFVKKLRLNILKSNSLSKLQAKEIWRYSVSTGLASVMLQLTYLLDILMIGQIVGNADAVAAYKVATIIPEGLLFIPSSIMLFVIPYFIENNKETVWFRSSAIKLLVVVEVAMVAISLILVISSSIIIDVFWGEQYRESVFPFCVLSISLAISPIRTVSVNLLAVLRELKLNLTISVLALITNIICIAFATSFYGINGASFAVLLSSAAAAAASFFSLLYKTSQRIYYMRNHKGEK